MIRVPTHHLSLAPYLGKEKILSTHVSGSATTLDSKVCL